MRKLKRLMANYDSDFNNMQINYLDQLSNKEFFYLFGQEKERLPCEIFKASDSFEGLNKVLVRDFNFSL